MEIAILPMMFGATLLLYWIRNKRYDVGFFMLLTLTVFALLSLMFYQHPYFPNTIHYGNGVVTYTASIYLFFCYLIWMYPVLKIKTNYVRISVNRNKVKYLFYLAIVVSLVMSILVLPKAIKGFNVIDIVANKEEVMEKGIKYTSGVLSIFVLLHSWLADFFIFLFMYSLTMRNINKWLKIGLGISTILPFILQTFAMSHRFLLAYLAINFFVGFLLFRNVLSKKTLKVVSFFGILLGLFVIYIMIDFSIKRFSDNTDVDGNFFLLKYVGEGMVNFNSLLFDHTNLTYNGNNSFPLVRAILGLDYTADAMQRRLMHVNFPTYLFYTFIGAFVSDIGKQWTLVLSIIMCFIFVKNINHKERKVIHLSTLMLVYYIATLCIKGVFYYPYISLNGNFTIIATFCVYLFLKYKTTRHLQY